ncbi:MAG: radical SAM protein [Candidatus Aenigmatarchaeota archaeon]
MIKLDHRHKPFDGDLLLTLACPVSCEFCVYSCTPEKLPEKWMPKETIERVAEQYSKNDIGIRISGGEPFYDIARLEECINVLEKYYEPHEILIITSGFFAVNEKNAKKYLRVLKRKKIDTLVVSSDRFHQKKIPLSNLENILEVAKNMGIEVALRITLDGESFDLLEKLANIITIHKTPIEVHKWYFVGRAEHIDKKPLETAKEAEEYFFKKIKEFAKVNNSPRDVKYYLTHTPKRSQRFYAPVFFPTTFPNGDVYGCSMTMKGCFLGNIHKEDLFDMILRWKKTLPGFFNLSTTLCGEIVKFMPEKYRGDVCNFCRNHPFTSPKTSNGRVYVSISMDVDLKALADGLNKNREYLLCFKLKENELNIGVGEKIEEFLSILKERGIKYLLSRPLPPCLGVRKEDKDPKDCYECNELFYVEDGKVVFCEPFRSFSGQWFEFFKDRKDIYEYFSAKKNELKVLKKCESCIYFLRKQCDGLCFRKI